jgi:hypothetical protein
MAQQRRHVRDWNHTASNIRVASCAIWLMKEVG